MDEQPYQRDLRNTFLVKQIFSAFSSFESQTLYSGLYRQFYFDLRKVIRVEIKVFIPDSSKHEAYFSIASCDSRNVYFREYPD